MIILCLDSVVITFMADWDRCERVPRLNGGKRYRIFRNEQGRGSNNGDRNEALRLHLNRHKVISKKVKSVKYIHVMREFSAAADLLATEGLEFKNIESSPNRENELSELNQIHEMIYNVTADSMRVQEAEMRGTKSLIQCVDGKDKAYANFLARYPRGNDDNQESINNSEETCPIR
ncbi:LOW QUALITY PROTEIN: hypothetical protein PHMEG_00015057 [Phytophthora megakarya]|uniref:Uncharacterized protein n=1 Tax=Phytophthora megakarya TaxID=4795 RepID=A0A225W2T9_9STRA|nr:LOW QUALITY PROTEIN: hypothetical protein PHMEG_00015057 [Phytophthora megakarya]